MEKTAKRSDENPVGYQSDVGATKAVCMLTEGAKR